MIKQVVLNIIKKYQKSKKIKNLLYTFFGIKNTKCKFYPTCSEYCYQAILKYGIIKGGLQGIRRIFKCHPWSKGGIDLVK